MSEPQRDTIYLFDSDTLLFIGTGESTIGPAGDVQLPAFSTLIAAPAADDRKVARATGIVSGHATAWEIVADWRNTELFKTTDGTKYVLNDPANTVAINWGGVGELPADLTTLAKPAGHYHWVDGAWVFDLDAAKAAAVLSINSKRDIAQSGPFLYDGNRFDGDSASLVKIAAAASLAAVANLGAQPYSIEWTTADNSVVTLDAAGMVALAMALSAHLTDCQQTAAQLKGEIASATDEASLAAVKWPTSA